MNVKTERDLIILVCLCLLLSQWMGEEPQDNENNFSKEDHGTSL